MNKSREEIINDMCGTYRRDFWFDRDPAHPLSAGVSREERLHIYMKMAQLFDNCISAFINHNIALAESQRILIDQQQKNMHTVRDLLLNVSELLE